MNIKQLNKNFNTQQKCLKYLEKMRWGKTVKCPFCHSKNTSRIKSDAGRHHCNDCKRHFSVLIGTIFQGTRLELPIWFQIIALMLNAKKGIASKQLMRDTGISYKTAWYVSMRVRCAMVQENEEMQNIVEMDEAYIGGKPRKTNEKQNANEPNLFKITNKRGRGTKKVPIVGIVERNGNVVLKVIEKLTSKNLMAMLKENVRTESTILITDNYKGYKKFDQIIEHLVIDHSKEFSRGVVHTNTIEGFWAIVKNSIRGQYIAISKKYLPFYLVQAQYVYNHRNYAGNLFEHFIKDAVSDEKQMLYYKPIKDVKKIVYKPKSK